MARLYSDLGPKQIRLVSFDGKPTLETLKLEAFDLDTCPSYVALSYRWGNPSNRDRVRINGIATTIHHNLAEALESIIDQVKYNRRVRKKNIFSTQHSPEYFWMDGICINQEDRLERGHQVQIMGPIFKNAEFVYAHLGDTRCSELLDAFALGRTDEIPAFETELWPLTHDLYWTRMWIVQELVLARKIKFICMNSVLDASALVADIKKHPDWGEVADIFLSPMHAVLLRTVMATSTTKKTLRFNDLVEVLYDLRKSHCSLMMDRIYSVLACIDWSLTPGIEPLTVDYTISMDQLLENVAERLATIHKTEGSEERWTAHELREFWEIESEDGKDAIGHSGAPR